MITLTFSMFQFSLTNSARVVDCRTAFYVRIYSLWLGIKNYIRFGWQHLQCRPYFYSIELMYRRRARDIQRENEIRRNHYWVIETYFYLSELKTTHLKIPPKQTENADKMKYNDNESSRKSMQWQSIEMFDFELLKRLIRLSRSYLKTSFDCSRATFRCVVQQHYVPNFGYTRTKMMELFSIRKISIAVPQRTTAKNIQATRWLLCQIFCLQLQQQSLPSAVCVCVCAFVECVLVFCLSLEQSAVPLFIFARRVCVLWRMYLPSIIGRYSISFDGGSAQHCTFCYGSWPNVVTAAKWSLIWDLACDEIITTSLKATSLLSMVLSHEKLVLSPYAIDPSEDSEGSTMSIKSDSQKKSSPL